MGDPASAFALRFVSGRYQGTVVPLPAEGELVLGRESDLDVVLAEELVSRRHARLEVSGGEVHLADLGSTNGTFLNGRRVKKARLAEGDRILVGTSLMRLVRADAPAGAVPPPLPASRETRRPAAMQGRLEEVPLPDLLQLLAGSRKTGVLAVEGAHVAGRIHLRDGKLVGASLAGAEPLAARKAFWRLARAEQGHFELGAPEDPAPEAALDEPLEALLMDAMRQVDELAALAPRLPAPGAALVLAHPRGARLRDLPPEALDALDAALDAGTFQAAVDRAADPDPDVIGRLLELVEKGVLALVPPTP